MSKEEAIVKAINENTGIKDADYHNAIVSLWMTFDPSPAMSVVHKAMDQYTEQHCINFLNFLKSHGVIWNANNASTPSESLYQLYKETQQTKTS